jgi:glyoxylase-like metal-dependent hydrolase (beta-lactamase superfamily II)
MKKLLAAAFSALALVPLAGAQDFDRIEIITKPVTGNIYMLQGSGGNIGVSIGDDGTFIIDDQFAPLTEKIIAAIAELTDKPVDFVVNSHWHYDHSDGNENFGRAGAYIVAQDNSRHRMETDQVVSLNGREQAPYDKIGLPKITFMDAMKFYFNDNTIDIIYSGPGHTDGDAQVYFREANVMHTGDMFVRYGLPFIDQPNGGSTDGMIDSIWELAGMINDETIVIPGHGELATRDDMLAYRDMLVTIRGRMQAAIARGMTEDLVVEANLTEGYAQPGPGTERWVRAAYEEYK